MIFELHYCTRGKRPIIPLLKVYLSQNSEKSEAFKEDLLKEFTKDYGSYFHVEELLGSIFTIIPGSKDDFPLILSFMRLMWKKYQPEESFIIKSNFGIYLQD